jgi:hypothetical protein
MAKSYRSSVAKTPRGSKNRAASLVAQASPVDVEFWTLWKSLKPHKLKVVPLGWIAKRKWSIAMGNCARHSALALLAVLVCCALMYGQGGEPQRTSNAPEPDLMGVWAASRRPPDKTRQYTLGEVVSSLGEAPPMTPWAEEKFKAAKPNGGSRGVTLEESNDTFHRCFPPGVPRIYTSGFGAPFEILQIPGRVVMIFEYDHIVRQIYTDRRQHPQDPNPTWMGDSIGTWEGRTLVVDTIGFNDKTWLDGSGHPHSEALHVVERIQRVNRDTMIDDITLDDPKAYTKPWVVHKAFELKPDWNLAEDVCEDNLNFRDLQKRAEAPK